MMLVHGIPPISAVASIYAVNDDLLAWCNSPNNPTFSYKDAIQRTECESIETTVRTRRLLWPGALLHKRGRRLPKRVLSGELENAGQRGPGRKENV